MITRAEHLVWAKARAIYYVDTGNLPGAVASMISDMGKHPDIELPQDVESGPLMDALMAAAHGDAEAVREWIDSWTLA